MRIKDAMNVSVVMLTYDRGIDIFERSLCSIISQTVKPSEIIVVNTFGDSSLSVNSALRITIIFEH